MEVKKGYYTKMELFENLGIDAGYLLLGALAGIVVLFVLLLICLSKIRKMNKKYYAFMKGVDGENLEAAILQRFCEIDKLNETTGYLSEKIRIINDNLLNTYQKVGIVKYDAFQEMGGKLSFSLVLLDKEDNGFVLTSMHTREGCYTYIKEIIKGEAYVILAEEERKALEEAKNKKNFIA